jgi:hypothetical protein
LLTPV